MGGTAARADHGSDPAGVDDRVAGRRSAVLPGPGHTPVIYAGTEVLELSPTDELQRTLDVVTKNMESAG